jgi:hypothetical protein
MRMERNCKVKTRASALFHWLKSANSSSVIQVSQIPDTSLVWLRLGRTFIFQESGLSKEAPLSIIACPTGLVHLAKRLAT